MPYSKKTPKKATKPPNPATKQGLQKVSTPAPAEKKKVYIVYKKKVNSPTPLPEPKKGTPKPTSPLASGSERYNLRSGSKDSISSNSSKLSTILCGSPAHKSTPNSGQSTNNSPTNNPPVLTQGDNCKNPPVHTTAGKGTNSNPYKGKQKASDSKANYSFFLSTSGMSSPIDEDLLNSDEHSLPSMAHNMDYEEYMAERLEESIPPIPTQPQNTAAPAPLTTMDEENPIPGTTAQTPRVNFDLFLNKTLEHTPEALRNIDKNNKHH